MVGKSHLFELYTVQYDHQKNNPLRIYHFSNASMHLIVQWLLVFDSFYIA
jgi:hypothetical protein